MEQRDIRVAVVGRVFHPNKFKLLALNTTLKEYFGLVKWYLLFGMKSKTSLHRNSYEDAKRTFCLNTALIQTARDKAVEILKSSQGTEKENRFPKPRKISIRFDKRCYIFSKTINVLTPYWLTLSLNRRERISVPVVFGKRQRERIDEGFSGRWQFTTVEMVRKDSRWYVHIVLKKAVQFTAEPETVIGIDRGETNLAVTVAISKSSHGKPIQGQFWKGEEIKRVRGLYGHIRRKLQEKKLIKKVRELKGKERRKANQQLHIIANQIVMYAGRFAKPIIVMENLTGIRDNFRGSKRLNRRFHSLPFRRLQVFIEYKANLEGIEVRYLTKQETRNTSKECHRCGSVARNTRWRKYICSNCGMEYNRELNAAVNIAHRLMTPMGWGSCEHPEPVYDGNDAKSSLNAGSLSLEG